MANPFSLMVHSTHIYGNIPVQVAVSIRLPRQVEILLRLPEFSLQRALVYLCMHLPSPFNTTCRHEKRHRLRQAQLFSSVICCLSRPRLSPDTPSYDIDVSRADCRDFAVLTLIVALIYVMQFHVVHACVRADHFSDGVDLTFRLTGLIENEGCCATDRRTGSRARAIFSFSTGIFDKIYVKIFNIAGTCVRWSLYC
jgi:hypothetical protein